MYLSGIEVEESDKNEDVIQNVKGHAWDKGIRIMGQHVIRTKRYPFVVGCKILIPQSQQYLALAPDTWPEEVTCREWEPAWKRAANNGYNNDYNNRDRFYDDYGSSDNYSHGPSDDREKRY